MVRYFNQRVKEEPTRWQPYLDIAQQFHVFAEGTPSVSKIDSLILEIEALEDDLGSAMYEISLALKAMSKRV